MDQNAEEKTLILQALGRDNHWNEKLR